MSHKKPAWYCFWLAAPQSGTEWDPTISSDCFRRLIQVYLYVLEVLGDTTLYKSTCLLTFIIMGAPDPEFSDPPGSGYRSDPQSLELVGSGLVPWNWYSVSYFTYWKIFLVGDMYFLLCLCKLLRCQLTEWNNDSCCDVWLCVHYQ